MANSIISVRIDPEMKAQAESLYSELGITLSEAVKIFIKKSINYGGIPFEVRVDRPNATTIAAMEDTIAGKNLSKPFDSIDDMMKDLLEEKVDA